MLGDPDFICRTAHTPAIILLRESFFEQMLPVKGHSFFAAADMAVSDLSFALYPKNSDIYPDIILLGLKLIL